ncbi:related to hydroxylase [Fusarium oxysporum]|uniref:Related to hydroxylase n=1 Tax=Fusarium oxysporum TaxID=5507 RepID=A0A2H3TGH8_FUSOX|nr:related to hydroxylase [Fusarium oxysporum]
MGFKVIIVGGSVAGLSVANMLEQFDIDYVLLEAYPQIAPQVGASIGILPNGFRILDQLGCFEPILDIAGDCRYTIGGMHGPDGLPLVASSPTSLSVHFEKRVGYPSIFIDRQMLLQVLYRNLKHKDRVLTKKRVSRVELVDGGVQACTQDGSVYEGDIVVGADGIHSAVRDEMWRLGKEQSPGYFPEDENSRVPVSTRCIFGISKRPSELGSRSQQMVIGEGHAYLIIAAPGDRTYWFLFDGLSETKFGKDISKYTKADEEGLVKGHRNDHITQDVTFGELYDRKIMSTLVPLEEYVFDRWHYKRIITIGDSAHKIDPASGQGGNGAMESAALLVNALVRQLKLSPQGLSDSQIDSALSEVHALRYERAKRLVEQAHSLQMMISQRFPFARFIFKHLISLFGQDAFIDIVTPICCEATRIQGIPVPKRPHFVPFEDELPAKPIKGGLVRRVPWVLATGTLGLSLFAALKSKDLGAGTGVFYSTLQQWGAGGLLAKVVGESPAAGLVHLIPVLSTWLIEGSRRGNSIIPLSWTTVYSLIYSLIGPSSVLPFFCLSSVLFSTKSTINRPVDPKIAKSIVPGVLLGYVAPTVAALLPIRDAKLRHYVGKLWQAYPLLCAVFTRGLAAIRTKTNNSEQPESDTKVEDRPINYAPPSELQLYKNEDVAPLKFSHGFALALSLAVPVITRAISSPDWTLSAISQVAPFGPNTGIISAASGLAYSLYAVWELRSLGFVRTKQAVLGGLASLGFLGLAGPGAMIAGIEYWREHVISSLSPETELL